METVKIAVASRQERGKGPARRLRRAGSVPAVIYAKGTPTLSVAVPTAPLRAAVSGGNVILELEGGIPGLPRYAVIKELQVDPVRRSWVHVDLVVVNLSEEMESSLPVLFVGTPVGVTEGGMLDDLHHEVTVRALPEGMPPALELDVSELAIGHHARVADLVAPEGVTIIDDPDALLASVLAPVVATAEEEEAAAAAAGEGAEVPEAGETEEAD
jgi:large subunit ribosomal protein L25